MSEAGRLREVYITGTGAFLPGEPVANDRMEAFLGRVGGRASAAGRRALRWNGIRTRHYALAEDGYTEKGGGAGFDLTVDKRTGDLLTGQALLALGWRIGEEVYWAPEIKAGAQ